MDWERNTYLSLAESERNGGASEEERGCPVIVPVDCGSSLRSRRCVALRVRGVHCLRKVNDYWAI